MTKLKKDPFDDYNSCIRVLHWFKPTHASITKLLMDGARPVDFTRIWNCKARTVSHIFNKFDVTVPSKYDTDAFAYCCHVWGFNAAEFLTVLNNRRSTRDEVNRTQSKPYVHHCYDGREIVFWTGVKRTAKKLLTNEYLDKALPLGLDVAIVKRLCGGYSYDELQKVCQRGGDAAWLLRNNKIDMAGKYLLCRKKEPINENSKLLK